MEQELTDTKIDQIDYVNWIPNEVISKSIGYEHEWDI